MPDANERTPLVSVERQVETDLATGRTDHRRFVKMYFEARDSGLLADIPDDLWKTLCVLATYIDDEGYCEPGQTTVAKALGISRQAVNGRIQRLSKYRFQGQTVLTVGPQSRARTAKGATVYGTKTYKLHAVSCFNYGRKNRSPASSAPDTGPQAAVSSPADTGESVSASGSVSGSVSSLAGHKQEGTRSKQDKPFVRDGFASGALSLVKSFHDALGRESAKPTKRELSQASELLASKGPHLAAFVVDYALKSAAETNFDMQVFGAVGQYVEDAEAAWGKKAASLAIRREQAQARRADRELEAYHDWRRREIERVRSETPHNFVEELTESVEVELASELGTRDTPGFDTAVRCRVDALLAEKVALADFEKWKRRGERRPRAA